MPGDAFGLAAEGHEGRAGVRGSRSLLDETASERPSTSLQWVVTRRASRAPAAAKKRPITHRCHAWHSTNRDGYDVCYGSATTCCRMPGSPPTAQITNPYSHAPHQRQVERWTLVGAARTSHSCD